MNKYISIIVFSILMVGCASKPMSIDQSFWSNSTSETLVVVHELPKENVLFKEGGQGLLDLVVSSIATQGITNKLKELDSSPFIGIRKDFVEMMESIGLNVKEFDGLINFKDYPKREKKAGYSDVDMSRLFEETGVDHIVVIQLLAYGASRSYYGFIPTSDPSGSAGIYGYMIDKNHKTLWDSGNSIKDSFIKEPVVGEWKQPPEYSNLLEASRRALKKSKRVLIDRFLEGR